MVGFDPVRQLVQQLEARYKNVAAFFYDSIGGRSIGIKWLGQNRNSHSVDLVAAHTQSAGLQCGKVQDSNFAARMVLADMACLGAGVIAGVHG